MNIEIEGLAIDHIEDKKGNTTVAQVINELGEKVTINGYIETLSDTWRFPPKNIFLFKALFTHTVNVIIDWNICLVALNSGYYDYNHFFKDLSNIWVLHLRNIGGSSRNIACLHC